MKKFIALFFFCIFLLSENVYGMNTNDFRLVEDLRSVPPATVRKKLKVGLIQMAMGTGAILLSPYVPHLGSTPSQRYGHYAGGRPVNYDLVCPENVKTGGRLLIIKGSYTCVSALYEEFNILQGSRLPSANPPDLLRNIRNGLMDIGLAGLIYTSHGYIPTFLMDSFTELGGPAVIVGTIGYFLVRGGLTLSRDLPEWASELDWSVAAHTFKEKTVSAYSRFATLVGRKPQTQTQ